MKDQVHLYIEKLWGREQPQPGLERVLTYAELLNHPEKTFPSILIGGTNGKGSTATYLARIFAHAGYRVGLYTSPHLMRFTERIKILSPQGTHEIPEHYIINFSKNISTLAPRAGCRPTYFEFATLAAFSYFAESHIDVAVIEVGLGGRWDATNIVQPQVAILTNVHLDHTHILGTTIAAIACEKVCIIKGPYAVVTGCEGEALDVVKKQCSNTGATPYVLHRDFTVHERKDQIDVTFQKRIFTCSKFSSYLPSHLVENLAMAVIAAFLFGLQYKLLQKSLQKITLSIPARCHIVSTNPLWIFDGAHNPAATERLVTWLQGFNKNFTLVYSRLQDKASHQLKILRKIAGEVFLVPIHVTSRNAPLDTLKEEASKANFDNIYTYPGVKKLPWKKWQKEKKNILLTGSFYLAGEAYSMVKSRALLN